jgi:hypothetical protein
MIVPPLLFLELRDLESCCYVAMAFTADLRDYSYNVLLRKVLLEITN